MNAQLVPVADPIRESGVVRPAAQPEKLVAKQSVGDIQLTYPNVMSLDAASSVFANGALSSVLCYRENNANDRGILCVSSDHRADSEVLDYEDRLHQLKRKFQVLEVAVSDIALLNSTDAAGTLAQEDEQAYVMDILREAARLDASDVHIQVRTRETIVRYRIHGRIVTKRKRTRREGEAWIGALYDTMCNEQTNGTFNDRKDSKANLRESFAQRVGLTGARVQFRPMKGWVYCVMRLMYPGSDQATTFESIGFLPDVHMPLVRYMMARTDGIIMVTGATGHGKSMTLKTMVEFYGAKRRQEVNIITIEDPTEYEMKGDSVVATPLMYNPEELESETRAWPLAIKSCMRLDPDAIMPGEMRDLNSALGATEAALTGHLVMTTLHVKDATASIERLRGLGVPRDLLYNPSVYVGLINQSLIPKLCKCAVPLHSIVRTDGSVPEDAIDADVYERLQETANALGYTDLSNVRVRAFHEGHDCDICGGIGEKGRALTAEICVPNQPFMRVYEKEGMTMARRHWVKQMRGMTKTMHAMRYVIEGRLDPSAVEEFIGPLNRDLVELGPDVYAKEGEG